MSLLILRFMFVKKHSGSFYYGNLHINQVPMVMVQILELIYIFFLSKFYFDPIYSILETLYDLSHYNRRFKSVYYIINIYDLIVPINDF
jgi:hypothetical protein